MNAFNKTFLIFSVLFLFTTASSFAEYKVGIINVKRIMKQLEEGKSVSTKLRASFKSKEKVLKDEEAKIKKLQQDFQKQDLVLSGKAKAKKQQDIQKAIMAYQKKTVDYQKQMQKEEAELKKPILDKLSKIVDQISKKQGVEMTFEASTSPVVYVKTRVDLDKEVISEYNKKHPIKKK
ncbi:OmpH family outer membrane protein [Bacteriovoracaceae bacterium]|nr:OmpH family outer membrane protein [Bacteriovoracaceae bacterium]